MSTKTFIDASLDFHHKAASYFQNVVSIPHNEQITLFDRSEISELLSLGEKFYRHGPCPREESEAHSWFDLLEKFYFTSQRLLGPAFHGQTLTGDPPDVPNLEGRSWPEKVTTTLNLLYAVSTLFKIGDERTLLDTLPEIFEYVRASCPPICRGYQIEQLVLLAIVERWTLSLAEHLETIDELEIRPRITKIPFAPGVSRRIPLQVITPPISKLSGRTLLAEADNANIRVNWLQPDMLDLTINTNQFHDAITVKLWIEGYGSTTITLPFSMGPTSLPWVTRADLSSWLIQSFKDLRAADRGIILYLPEGNLCDVRVEAPWISKFLPGWNSVRSQHSNPRTPSRNQLSLHPVDSASRLVDITARVKRALTFDASILGFLENKFPGIGATDPGAQTLINLMALLATRRAQAKVLNRIVEALSQAPNYWYITEDGLTEILARLGGLLVTQLRPRLRDLQEEHLALLKALHATTKDTGNSTGDPTVGEIAHNLIKQNGITEIQLNEILSGLKVLNEKGWLEIDATRHPPRYLIPRSVRTVISTILEELA